MSSLTDAVVGPDEGDAGTATAISSSPQGAGAKKHLDAWEQRKLTKVHEELVSLRQATNFLHPLPWRSEHRPAGVVDVDLTLLGQDLKHGDIETSAEFWEDLHLLVHNVQIFAEFELKARSILTQKEAEAAERINTVAAGEHSGSLLSVLPRDRIPKDIADLLIAAADFLEIVKTFEEAYQHELETHRRLATDIHGIDYVVDAAADAVAHALHTGYHSPPTQTVTDQIAEQIGFVLPTLDEFGSLLYTFGGTLTDSSEQTGKERKMKSRHHQQAEKQSGSAESTKASRSVDKIGHRPQQRPREFLRVPSAFAALHDQFLSRGLKPQLLADVQLYIKHEMRDHWLDEDQAFREAVPSEDKSTGFVHDWNELQSGLKNNIII